MRCTEWRERLEQWKKSGKHIEVFAKEKKLPLKQLKWWRWRLGYSSVKIADARPPDFLPVRVIEAQAPPLAGVTVPIEIALPNGCVVRVAPGFDASTLQRVIAIASEYGPC